MMSTDKMKWVIFAADEHNNEFFGISTNNILWL